MKTLPINRSLTPVELKPFRTHQAPTLVPFRLRRERPEPLPTTLIRAFAAKPQAVAQPLAPLPPARTYAAHHAEGWLSRLVGHDMKAGERIEIELPLGTPRYINAATLKRMLGANDSDKLLKKAGRSWTICENGAVIDLVDTTTEYRVGPVAIYS